ncbi:hypothetical protein JB92DRAFT_416498 [Gautieria morchelliformis]|nr:hypothetical protein JB92DRAFT_416498 [Gautieria morchelliformis]
MRTNWTMSFGPDLDHDVVNVRHRQLTTSQCRPAWCRMWHRVSIVPCALVCRPALSYCPSRITDRTCLRLRVACEACIMRCGALVWSGDIASSLRKPAPSIYLCLCHAAPCIEPGVGVLHVCLALALANILM